LKPSSGNDLFPFLSHYNIIVRQKTTSAESDQWLLLHHRVFGPAHCEMKRREEQYRITGLKITLPSKGSCKAAFWKEGEAFTVPALVTKATTNKTFCIFFGSRHLFGYCVKNIVPLNTVGYVCEYKKLNVYQYVRSMKWRLSDMAATNYATQPDLAPWYFFAHALGVNYLNGGYCDVHVPRRKLRTIIEVQKQILLI